MKHGLYNLGIFLLQFGVRVHALFNKKSKAFVTGRKNQFDRLYPIFKVNSKPVAWFHCASLGEFEQGRPVIEEFAKGHKDYFILLTFFSPSGYEMKKNYSVADHVDYLPLDLPQHAKQFVDIVNPRFAFFVKYEFWHNYLKRLSEAECWVFSISTILRSSQRFFKFYGGFSRKTLSYFDHFFVQNSSTNALLKGINIHNVTVAGDTRFDRVYSIANHQQPQKNLSLFSANSNVIIGGSTWAEDVEVIADFLHKNTGWKAIIAPHDVGEQMLKKHESLLPNSCVRFSELPETDEIKARIILIDSIGMLSSLYQYGTFAFIGGAFGKGLHNTLEAACFGLPVFFGNKNYSKFQEARDLIEIGAGYPVKNSEDFNRIFSSIKTADQLTKASESAKDYVRKQIGASEIIIEHVDNVMKAYRNE